MARISQTASRQIDDLVDYYLSLDRLEATNLRNAIATVLAKIDRPRTRFRNFPASYSSLSELNMLWIKQHVYWIGCIRDSNGVMVVANVIYERANIPSRVQPFNEATYRWLS